MFNWKFNSKKERGASWYTLAIIIALVLIIWWFIMGLYVMSIVVFMFVWVYLLVDNNYPEVIEVIINENGIKIGDSFYDYSKIETFSIIYDRENPVLLRLRLTQKGFKVLDIPLINTLKTSNIREFLLRYIQEDEKWELSATDKILNYLKI